MQEGYWQHPSYVYWVWKIGAWEMYEERLDEFYYLGDMISPEG